MQCSTVMSVVPGLGRLIAGPELLASVRAIVGTVTNTHLAENLLTGDLDEIVSCWWSHGRSTQKLAHFLELVDFRGMIFAGTLGSAEKMSPCH